MSDSWLAFLGGILATLVGGLVASIVQRHNEAVKRKAEAHLDVYFRLLGRVINQFPFALEGPSPEPM